MGSAVSSEPSAKNKPLGFVFKLTLAKGHPPGQAKRALWLDSRTASNALVGLTVSERRVYIYKARVRADCIIAYTRPLACKELDIKNRAQRIYDVAKADPKSYEERGDSYLRVIRSEAVPEEMLATTAWLRLANAAVADEYGALQHCVDISLVGFREIREPAAAGPK